jgi:hypothetical protein
LIDFTCEEKEMMRCFGKAKPSADSADRPPATERELANALDSGHSLGEVVENLQQYASDPQRQVDKMSSGLSEPQHASNKCILV